MRFKKPTIKRRPRPHLIPQLTPILAPSASPSSPPLSQDLLSPLTPDDLTTLSLIPRRRHLRRHPLYKRLAPTIDALLSGFAWHLNPLPPDAPLASPWPLRAVAWNIERGKRFDPLLASLTLHPSLRDADLLLLTEVDIGMGRSQNRHVPQALAHHLGMQFVFANSHLVLSPGDSGEQDHHTPNTRSLHGCALLSKRHISRFCSVPLPERVDKFHAFEKRLGCKRALIAEVLMDDGPLTVAVVHLDPFCSPKHRAFQIGLVLDAIHIFSGDQRALLGGDLNTNTYNLTSGITLVTDILKRLTQLKIPDIIHHYQHPHLRFERPVFDRLSAAGFSIDSLNNPNGTLHYNVDDPEIVQKSQAYMPRRVWEGFRRRLQPGQETVGMHLDWFASKHLTGSPGDPLPQYHWHDLPISDHDPISAVFEPLPPSI
jgi:endonuclease/exonuclease/phosphatase family metal-dependent hydrolase